MSRKTKGFSKVKEWLEKHMKLYCTYFNFFRGYGGLKYKDERGIECKILPQEKQGLKSQTGFKETTEI